MLGKKFKKQYLLALADCNSTLFRHPYRTMAERLQVLVPLAEQYAEVDCYGQGALVSDFEQQVADLLGHKAALFLPSGTMAKPWLCVSGQNKNTATRWSFIPLAILSFMSKTPTTPSMVLKLAWWAKQMQR